MRKKEFLIWVNTEKQTIDELTKKRDELKSEIAKSEDSLQEHEKRKKNAQNDAFGKTALYHNPNLTKSYLPKSHSQAPPLCHS
jgi:chromosome segregation ATPase